MTPQEKAKELYNKFIQVDGVIDEVWPHTIAKQCALICVEEILNELKEFDNMDGYAGSRTDYWQQVKTSIESL